MAGSIDFQPYLESICRHYAEWWKLYTLTDIEGKTVDSSNGTRQHVPFDFGLLMQSVKYQKPEVSQQERTEKLERRPILEGLRRSLAEAKHVLLIGRPGSGKSTALARLLLEEAQQNQSNTVETCKIPVLVELRYYEASILDLIRDFFRRHDLVLETHQVETLLSNNQLLLLIDGLNELSSEAARQDVVKLRNYRHVPMIFTTRDLSLGGDFGIEKQWEMLPLTEPQMRSFIQVHLSPEQADELWRQLHDRTRKLAETPLLLWMLCELFAAGEEIPRNLGEVFRLFTRAYENSSIRRHEVAALKGDIQAVSDRRLWFPALKHLAYVMMQGETPVDSRTVISREAAERELKQLFREEASPPEAARNCLDDLLKYHLLQIKSGHEIEFRHQLFQEYYAAEWLLQRLPSLTDEQLKYYFLNYLKWTEAIALVLKLLDDEVLAVWIVKLALQVDLMLGARLAGEVKSAFQMQTVSLIDAPTIFDRPVPKWLKFKLLEKMRSEAAIALLLTTLERGDPSAAETLGKIGGETALLSLLTAFSNENPDVRISAMEGLKQIGGETAVSAVRAALNDENSDVRNSAAYALGQVEGDDLLYYNDWMLTDWQATEAALKQINSETAISVLLTALSDANHYVRKGAARRLGEIEGDAASSYLPKLTALIPTLGEQAIQAIFGIQAQCKFYNYDIAQSDLLPPINSEKLSANGSTTYIFQSSVGNVAHIVHGNQIIKQQTEINEQE